MSTEPQDANTADAKQKPAGFGWIKAYLAVYAILFVAYVIYSFTGGKELTPQEYVKAAFGGKAVKGMSREELGTLFDKTTGSVLLWDELSMSSPAAEIRLPADEQLTRAEGVEIGMAILNARNPAELPPISINDTGISGHLWAYGMTIYNIFGLFLLIVVYLRQPLVQFLEQNARETGEALREAREAKAEAEKLKQQYQAMLKEVEAEKERMEKTAESELDEEREHILKSARHEAEGMLEMLQASLDTELRQAQHKLRADIAREATALARDIVAKEAGDDEHNRAVDAFVSDLKEAKLP